ncbi:integrase core domain-containing protein [Larkinella humicola]|uniref:Transposase family protein n=1 Tax=Larkinella humicola TaxID=2607654 RepID=A0A5N1J4Q7_9BACT|nr:integrase core domain-containing protein [Larkinella humicola]KAA9341055.1 transposase family protein [Larkinella humicola]
MRKCKNKIPVDWACGNSIPNASVDDCTARAAPSDRGIQYCSQEYTKLLKTNKIRISMTEQADPYENALAEWMNRTLKEEFALDRTFLLAAHARQLVKEAIAYYNHVRPHTSCGYRKPEQAHHCQGPFVKLWRQSKRKALDKVQDPLSYANT